MSTTIVADSEKPGLGRRELLAYSAAFGTAFLARQGMLQGDDAPPADQSVNTAPPTKRYEMKTSINLWAFPYPDKWSLEKCLRVAKDAGFDAVELNFNLEGEFSAESSPPEIVAIRQLAERIGIQISGVCSFLFWPYCLTQNDEAQRRRGVEIAKKMIEATRLLEIQNMLVVPGAVYAPWQEGFDPVPNEVCAQRARQAIGELLPLAEKAGVYLNLENIFANGFLFSPQEMMAFVDQFQSRHVQVHFDTGNIMQYQFPEHWVPLLGQRIRNVHFKEWDKRGNQGFDLYAFRTLLDGTTNWPAVIAALDQVGYRGYLTFEYFHPFLHYPEALIYQTAAAFDWLLGTRTA